MARAIHSVSDWSDTEIAGILRRARALADGAPPEAGNSAEIGLCFFQTSLRTRVGFEVAAHRIGAYPVVVAERRSSTVAMPESLEDTLRVLSGYCDAVVVRSHRSSRELAKYTRAGTAWLNAGDAKEHPTQALIDLFAIERLNARVEQLHIAIVGDLRMRSARSLLELLERRQPRQLTLVTHSSLANGASAYGTTLERVADLPDENPDVVYLAGIPHEATSEEVRGRLRLDSATIQRFAPETTVLSPLPVIDEIASNARSDARIHWFEQSDLGLFVRIALLEWLLGRSS